MCGSEAGGVRLTVRGEKWRESWLGVGGEEGRVKVTGEGGVRGREWGVGGWRGWAGGVGLTG